MFGGWEGGGGLPSLPDASCGPAFMNLHINTDLGSFVLRHGSWAT